MRKIIFAFLLTTFCVSAFPQDYAGRRKNGFDLSTGIQRGTYGGVFYTALKYGYSKNKFGFGYKYSPDSNGYGLFNFMYTYDRIFLSSKKIDAFFHTHVDYNPYHSGLYNGAKIYNEFTFGLGFGANLYLTKRLYVQSTGTVLGYKLSEYASHNEYFFRVSLGLGVLLHKVD